MYNFLIIGGNGFLGKTIVKQLLTKCVRIKKIKIFDKKSNDINWNDNRVETIIGDITNLYSVSNAMFNMNIVFHCANLSENNINDFDVNYFGALNIINSCLLHNVKCLIYTSVFDINKYKDYFYRGSEYNDYCEIFDSVFMSSKHKAEINILKVDRTKTASGNLLRTCSIRIYKMYGENDKNLKKIFSKAIKTKSINSTCYNNAIQHSSVYVGNVAWMHILAYKALTNVNKADIVGGHFYFCYDNSPFLSYDDFYLAFLNEFNITLKKKSKNFLYLTSKINTLINKFKYNPSLLTVNTLKKINTHCTIETDKAEKDFCYKPIYNWNETKYNVLSWLLTLV